MATRNFDSDLGYDTHVLQDEHDERQASLSGRQNRHVEALFRLLHTTSLGRRHDVLSNHRNTPIIPASRVYAEAQLASLVKGPPHPGNRSASEGCPSSAWRNWPRCT